MTKIGLDKNYVTGVLWFTLSLFCSVINDTIMKQAGIRLPVAQIIFLRFFFSVITLIPFILHNPRSLLFTGRPTIHFIRGTLFYVGILLWTKALTVTLITTATLVSFTIPFFTLILAQIFLKEDIIWQRWVATIIGFFGIIIILEPHSTDFNPIVIILIISAIMFATLDIINKTYVIKETMLSMLFYSALATSMLSVSTAVQYWVSPTYEELFLFLILGASANLILYFILKAFAIIDATAVAPYRYLELILSASFGYIFFNEIPKPNTWIGALIVIPATIFISYSESKRTTQK